MAKYTAKLGDKICYLTARSTVGLRKICKQLRLPYSTVTDWVHNRDHDIYIKYKQAKADQLYCLQDEILELRLDSSNDYITVVKNGKSRQVLNRQHLARTGQNISSAMMLITKFKATLDKELRELQKHQGYNDSGHAGDSIKTLSSGAPENVFKSAASKSLTAPGTQQLSNTSLPEPVLSSPNGGKGRGEARTSVTGAPENTLKPATSNYLTRVIARNEATSRNAGTLNDDNNRNSIKINDSKTLVTGAPENTLKPATSNHLNRVIARNEATSQNANTAKNENNSKTSVTGAPENILKPATSNHLTRVIARNEATSQNADTANNENNRSSIKINDSKTSVTSAPENTLKSATSNHLTRVITRNEATSQNADTAKNENNSKTSVTSAPENALKPTTSNDFTRIIARNEATSRNAGTPNDGNNRNSIKINDSKTSVTSAPENTPKTKPGKPHKRILNSYFHAGRGRS